MRFRLKELFKSNIAVYLVFVIFTLICYGNILPNKLFYDDEELIYKNAYIADLHYLPKYFTQNMVAGAGKTSNMYRPVLLISLAFDHFIWGLNPVGYHLTSIALHLGNGIMIFLLINMLFGSRILAIVSALFFLIHPVQTEAVTYASGRTDLLYSFFGLICINLFLIYCSNVKKWAPFYLLSVLFFLLSLLSKETAVVLPLAIILCFYVLSQKNKIKILPSQISLSVSWYFLIDIIYIVLRLTVLNFANTLNFYKEANSYSQNIATRFFTFTGVFFEYLKVLLFPKDLIFARNIDIITTAINLSVIIFVILAVITVFYFSITGKKNPVVFFYFFWFFIFLLPSSGIIPINSIIAEHYLYLPSIGFFLFISYLFNFFLRKYNSTYLKFFLVIILLTIISVFSIRTIIRNYDWKDPITFYNKSLTQSPNNIPMRHNLAMAYSEKGEFETAIKEYQYIIAASDVYPNTHHNLGNIYKEQKKYKDAEEEYLKALQIDRNFIFSYYALADLYKLTGETEKLNNVLEILKKYQ